ncbi:MAG: type I restriction-modification system subunit M N-terminal domain-containing protein [Actinomycetota bacterium]
MSQETINNHAAPIWSVADRLRGDYTRSKYGKVSMPLMVIRWLDAVLAPVKEKVLERHAQLVRKLDRVDPVLTSVSSEQFSNASKLELPKQRVRVVTPS